VQESKQLLVEQLLRVELPLGHVPDGRVGRHQVVGEHVEQLDLEGAERLARDAVKAAEVETNSRRVCSGVRPSSRWQLADCMTILADVI
jgi:hypothetical protein